MAAATSISNQHVSMKRVAEAPPIYTRLYYAIAAYALYTLNKYGRRFQAKQPANTLPDAIKTYQCRSKLPVRIFFPKNHDTSLKHPLPTLFSIHGGGFVMGDPVDTDEWNSTVARSHSILVIALNYAKAPFSRFPAPVFDVEQLILAALADDTLPIDKSRIAVSGFSAGGNLALSVSALPSMRDGEGGRKIHAVIPLYPVADLSVPRETKVVQRRYKPELGGFRARATDYLYAISPVFNWAYIPKGTDLTNTLLSPAFSAKEDLPPYVFSIACELDMLAAESWRMICRLAGRKVVDTEVGREAVAGKGELVLDDPTFCFEEKGQGFGYKWLLVPDAIHGFDGQIDSLVRDEELMVDARLKTAKVQELIGAWLLSGAFSDSK